VSKPSSQLSIGAHSVHDPLGGWSLGDQAPILEA
jgi:hypothetical protein